MIPSTTPSIFGPASDCEILIELSRMTREDLLALAQMHISFQDEGDADSTGREAYYRRRELARELINGASRALPPSRDPTGR